MFPASCDLLQVLAVQIPEYLRPDSAGGLDCDMTIECPHCGEKPATNACGPCGREIPSWAKYCPFCGEVVPQKPEIQGGDPFAMENRRLCPDGNCIGILGPDGRCVICGKS